MNWSKTKWVAFLLLGLFGLFVQFCIKTVSQPMPKTTVYAEIIQRAEDMGIKTGKY